MNKRKSSINSTTDALMFASQLRRLSQSRRQEDNSWRRKSSEREYILKRQPSVEKPVTYDETNVNRGLNRFRSAVKATVENTSRRKSDTFLFGGDMSDNRRRGTITGNNGISGKRKSADFALREGKHSNLLALALNRRAEERRRKLLQKFRIIAKAVGYWIHLCHRVAHDNEFSLTYRPEMKRLTELLAVSDGQVPCINRIDVSYYKANTQMRMSQEGKRILSKIPTDRTEKEIQYAAIALRNIKTIADYPLHIQQQLAKYGFFESYDPKRVIIKEGRPTENYYILIYGQVLFAKIDEGNMAKKLGSLYRGYYFGELGIYNGTPRQSSIITEEYTELLRVSDVDFKRIFMGGDISQNPQGDTFLTNVMYLKGWPLHVLKGNKKEVVTSYFQRNVILTKDSNLSQWIFIVKSGSIKVMKKLLKTNANASKKTGMPKHLANTDGYSAFLSNEKEYQRYTLYNDIETPPPLHIDGDDIRHEVYDGRNSPLTLPLIMKLQRACRPHTAKPDVKYTRSKLRRRPSTSLSSGYERPRSFKLKSVSSMESSNSQLLIKSVTPRSDLEEPNDTSGRRTIFDDWDAATKQKQEITEADLNPQFVRVQTLSKGEVFGLQYILYKGQPQPSFSVISNGAECIKIHRRIFEEHLSFTVKSELLKLVPPYPSDEYLQDRLVTQMNWNCFKDVLLHNTMEEHKKLNELRYGSKPSRIKLK